MTDARADGLLAVIGETTSSFATTFSLPKEFAPIHVFATVENLRKTIGHVEPKAPARFELETIYNEVKGTWERTKSLRDLAGRNLRMFPWVLFYPEAEQEKWLGAVPDLVMSYFAWLEGQKNANTIASFIKAFLKSYPSQIETFPTLLAGLNHIVGRATARRLSTWRQRCDKYRLLHQDGPRFAANHLASSSDSVDSVLADMGMDDFVGVGAFAAEIQKEFLSKTSESLRAGQGQGSQLDRALSYVAPNGTLRFKHQKERVAESFLLPFVSKNPDAQTQDVLRRFLINAFGDPRVRAGDWAFVNPDAKKVLMRWLVSDTLDLFFQLLDQCAMERHWRERKAFWSAYLNRDVISDAWVVLGPEAQDIAKRVVKKGSSYGRFTAGAYIEKNHSVLLMRIGSTVITDWSHNGAARFWNEGDKQAPKFYQAIYDRSDFMHGERKKFRHQGEWRERVADYVANNTGVRIRSHEYRTGGAY